MALFAIIRVFLCGMDNYFVRMHQYFGEKHSKKQELENAFLDAEDATLTVR